MMTVDEGNSGAPVAALDRAARAKALRMLLGPAPEAARPLADAIRRVARRHFDAQVVPLVARYWPSVIATPFMDKLRIGACDLYAVAPYTALFCGERPPSVVRAIVALGDRLPLPDVVFSRLGAVLMEALGRVALQRTHRQIALVAAFIVVVDHVFDHCMEDPPAHRGRRLEAVIRGELAPDGPPLALVRALAAAMGDGLDAREAAVFAAAMDKVYGWLGAEVRALSGVPDPFGEGHRRAGVEGTIEGLLFPVAVHAGASSRAWMNEVSMFVQMVDDLLDIEQDQEDGRPTPATEGRWTDHEVGLAWRATLSGLEALVRRQGPHFRAFPRRMVDVYRRLMVELVDAMIARPGDGFDAGGGRC